MLRLETNNSTKEHFFLSPYMIKLLFIAVLFLSWCKSLDSIVEWSQRETAFCLENIEHLPDSTLVKLMQRDGELLSDSLYMKVFDPWQSTIDYLPYEEVKDCTISELPTCSSQEQQLKQVPPHVLSAAIHGNTTVDSVNIFLEQIWRSWKEIVVKELQQIIWTDSVMTTAIIYVLPQASADAVATAITSWQLYDRSLTEEFNWMMWTLAIMIEEKWYNCFYPWWDDQAIYQAEQAVLDVAKMIYRSTWTCSLFFTSSDPTVAKYIQLWDKLEQELDKFYDTEPWAYIDCDSTTHHEIEQENCLVIHGDMLQTTPWCEQDFGLSSYEIFDGSWGRVNTWTIQALPLDLSNELSWAPTWLYFIRLFTWAYTETVKYLKK